VVLVALDESPDIRVVGNVVDVAPEEIHIGMAVTAVWERREVDGDVIELPLWSAGSRET
jgi:uncharacterized OB-fold protein